MRLIVSGTRRARLEHRQTIAEALVAALVCAGAREPHTLAHGNAGGVDTIAAGLAREWGWTVEQVAAEWDRYGPAAGPRRNAALIATGTDLVAAFPSTGESKGTWDLIQRAVAAGLPVNVRPLRIEEARLL